MCELEFREVRQMPLLGHNPHQISSFHRMWHNTTSLRGAAILRRSRPFLGGLPVAACEPPPSQPGMAGCREESPPYYVGSSYRSSSGHIHNYDMICISSYSHSVGKFEAAVGSDGLVSNTK